MKKPQSRLTALVFFLLTAAFAAHSQDKGPFNFYINFAGAYQADNGSEDGPSPWSGSFRARDLRLEVKGRVNENLYYRFRHNLRSNQATGTLDGFSKGLNMMFAGYEFNEHFAIEAGKICQHWGGFDYDENPLYIYQYSDYIDHIDIFFTGIDFYWRPDSRHEFVFELSNPANDLLPVRFPVNALLNWNGNLLDGFVQTRCAIGGMTQSEGGFGKLLSGGIKFNWPTFQCYFDTMFEKDAVDRIGIATADFGPAALRPLGEILYNSNIVKAFWQFSPGWNLVAKGSWDTVRTDVGGKYRDGLMALCVLEYYPEPSQDLRLFAAATLHRVIFNGTGLPDSFTTGRAELGLIYRIKVF